MFHKVSLAKINEIQRLAVLGVPANEAAERAGCDRQWLREYMRRHGVPFQPIQNRGMPGWLVPEAARRAEQELRRTWARVRYYGDPYAPEIDQCR